jgi:GAF domain-containing protein
VTELARVLEKLLVATGASRVTLRRDDPGDYAFPVVEEALEPGAPSLRDERTVDLRRQPVVRELMLGHQVVQDDCRAAYDDPAFHAMLEAYGGLAAQIVTPVLSGESLAAIVSVHQLGRPRRWSDVEIDAASEAADRIGALL